MDKRQMSAQRFFAAVSITILVLLLSVVSQLWVPVFIIPLSQEAQATIQGYFAAARGQDAAVAIKFLAYPGTGVAAEKHLADTLNLLKGFYDIQELSIKERYYFWPKAWGQLIWVECTAFYAQGREWDVDIILLKTEQGWKIETIKPALEARNP